MKFDIARQNKLLDANDRIEAAKRKFDATMRRLAPIGTKLLAQVYFHAEKKYELVPATIVSHSDGQCLMVEVADDVVARVREYDRAAAGQPNRLIVYFAQLRFPIEE